MFLITSIASFAQISTNDGIWRNNDTWSENFPDNTALASNTYISNNTTVVLNELLTITDSNNSITIYGKLIIHGDVQLVGIRSRIDVKSSGSLVVFGSLTCTNPNEQVTIEGDAYIEGKVKINNGNGNGSNKNLIIKSTGELYTPSGIDGNSMTNSGKQVNSQPTPDDDIYDLVDAFSSPTIVTDATFTVPEVISGGEGNRITVQATGLPQTFIRYRLSILDDDFIILESGETSSWFVN